jgi:hypothetical protein
MGLEKALVSQRDVGLAIVGKGFNSSPEVMIVTIPHPFSAAHTRKEFEN